MFQFCFLFRAQNPPLSAMVNVKMRNSAKKQKNLRPAAAGAAACALRNTPHSPHFFYSRKRKKKQRLKEMHQDQGSRCQRDVAYVTARQALQFPTLLAPLAALLKIFFAILASIFFQLFG